MNYKWRTSSLPTLSLCLDPPPPLPISPFHATHGLIIPAAHYRDTRRNRWLPSNSSSSWIQPSTRGIATGGGVGGVWGGGGSARSPSSHLQVTAEMRCDGNRGARVSRLAQNRPSPPPRGFRDTDVKARGPDDREKNVKWVRNLISSGFPTAET